MANEVLGSAFIDIVGRANQQTFETAGRQVGAGLAAGVSKNTGAFAQAGKAATTALATEIKRGSPQVEAAVNQVGEASGKGLLSKFQGIATKAGQTLGIGVKNAANEAEGGLTKATGAAQRLQEAQQRLTVAQSTYNERIQQYGTASIQAQRANLTLMQAQRGVADAQGRISSATDHTVSGFTRGRAAGGAMFNTITQNAGGALGPLTEIQEKLLGFGAAFHDTEGRAGKAFLGIGAAATSAGVLFENMAGKDKVAMELVKGAVEGTGKSWEDYEKPVERASQAGAKFGFTSAQTATALATLTRMTKDPAKAMQDLQATEQVAVARHMDLNRAAMQVSRALGGNTRAAMLLGITVPSATKATAALNTAQKAVTSTSDGLAKATHSLSDLREKQAIADSKGKVSAQTLAMQHIALKNAEDAVSAASEKHRKAQEALAEAQKSNSEATNAGTEAVKKLSEQYGGAANAQMHTFSGTMHRLGAEVDNYGAKFGKTFSHDLVAAGPLLMGFGALVETGMIGKLGRASKFVTGIGLEEGKASLATKAWTGAQAAFNAVMEANPLILITTAVIALGVAFYLAYTKIKPFHDFINDIGHVVAGAARAISSFATGVFHDISHGIGDAIDWVKQHWPLLLSIFAGPFAPIVLAVTLFHNQILGFFERIWHDVTNTITRLWHDLTGIFTNLWRDVTNTVTRLWHDLTGFFTNIWHDIDDIVTRMWHNEVSFWTNLWHDVTRVAHSLWSDVTGVFHGIENDVTAIFRDTVNGVSSAWGRLAGVFKSPVNVVIDVVNKFDSIVDDITGAVGLGRPLPSNLPHMQTGGQIPGFGGGDKVPIVAEAGEYVVNKYAAARNAGLLESINSKGQSGDGIHYGIGGWLNPIHDLKAAAGALGDAGSWVADKTLHLLRAGAGDAVQAASLPVRALLDGLGGSLPGRTMRAGVDHGFDDIVNWVKGKETKEADPGPAGAGVARWDPVIRQAMGMVGIKATDAAIHAVEQIIKFESGGNPSIVNTWDINAQEGHPSMGLMQEIMTTFLGNHVTGTSMSILDPLANVASSLNYILRTYGNLFNVPGIKAMASGGHYVGYESGTNYVPNTGLALIHQGEMVIREPIARAARMAMGGLVDLPAGQDNSALVAALAQMQTLPGQYASTSAAASGSYWSGVGQYTTLMQGMQTVAALQSQLKTAQTGQFYATVAHNTVLARQYAQQAANLQHQIQLGQFYDSIQTKLIGQTNATTQSLQNQAATIGGQLTSAVKTYYASTFAGIQQSYAQNSMANSGLTSLFNVQAGYGAGSASSAISYLQQQVAQSKAFASNLRTLAAMGLDPVLLQQLAAAGASTAGAITQSLMNDPSSVAQINALEAQLNTQAQAGGQAIVNQALSTLTGGAGLPGSAVDPTGAAPLMMVQGDLVLQSQADITALGQQLYFAQASQKRATGTWGAP